MLQEAVTWYGQQMAAMLPSLAGRSDRAPDGLVASLDSLAARPPAMRLAQRRRGREVPVGRFVLDTAGIAAARAAVGGGRRGTVLLHLPPGALLERILTLPLAAEASLARVVEYEMDRYTPFTADEVHWSVQTIGRDRAQGRLRVQLLVVPRAPLAAALAGLRQVGATVSGLEGQPVGGGAVHRLSLVQRDPRRARRQRRALLAAAALCTGLLLAVVGLPFWRQAQAMQAVSDRVAALQPDVSAAEALRQKLAAEAAGSDAIEAERVLLGEPLQAIAALTQILPDDTYLTALVLQKRQLSIEGQSANAARLIGSLSIDPVIRNAAFAAPVTRSESGADLFSIKAEVRP